MQELAWWGEEDTTELLVIGGMQYLAGDINKSSNHRWNSSEIKDSEQDTQNKTLFQWMKKDKYNFVCLCFKSKEIIIRYNKVIKKIVVKKKGQSK